MSEFALSRRRWFRYSLRTMFVVVTVFAIWLGYQAHWLHQRRSAFTTRRLNPDSDVYVKAWSMPYDPVRAPGLLWMFGEQGVQELHVDFFIPDRRGGEPLDLYPDEEVEAERIHRLFPETEFFIPARFYVR